MIKNTINLYSHSGSFNKGCEAIVRGTYNVLSPNYKIELFSENVKEDFQSDLNHIVSLNQINVIKKYSIKHIIAYLYKLIFKSSKLYYFFKYKKIISKKSQIALSIGGDNYFYGNLIDELAQSNSLISKYNKTILWGCSIDSNILSKKVIRDLLNYEHIIARESITYEVLLKHGIPSSMLSLFPDPAFTLNKSLIDISPIIINQGIIGINFSPLVNKLEIKKGLIIDSLLSLVNYLLLNTDYYIAFIPHVFWSHNNDLDFLLELKKHFINNPRVLLFVENRSDKIKGIISQCRFFIGARTHSVIAAYSSMIPTLAIGYSVKAIGIAKDIFGSSDNYVIPINEISNNQVLINKFDWIIKNEKIIRTHLNNFMPGYIQKTYKIIEIINNLNKNV